jgi:putative NIF3 family GTP cyclohydrolase 1 type 2
MAAEVKVSDVLAQLRTASGDSWRDEAWDGIQAGSLDSPVKGIVVTWTPDLAVLRKAVAGGSNLILCKDPLYWYEQEDKWPSVDSSSSRIQEGAAGRGHWDPVVQTQAYKVKKQFIDSNNLTIYRMSANWDGPNSRSTEGLLNTLGWKADEMLAADPRFPSTKTAIVTVPEQSLIDLGKYAKQRVGSNSARLMGERNARVRRVAVHPGYITIQAAVKITATPNLDAIVTGEGCEWEALPCTEDWVTAGHGKGFLMLGLAAVSDTGARQVASWVKTSVPSAKVEFMADGDPFTPVYAGELRA